MPLLYSRRSKYLQENLAIMYYRANGLANKLIFPKGELLVDSQLFYPRKSKLKNPRGTQGEQEEQDT